jgi:GT2 family glycosyltransferase
MTALRRPGAPATADVIVCTRGRPQQLGPCLNALAGQPGLDRLLVVENGAPASAAHDLAAGAGASYLVEPRRGSSPARNRGLRAAAADLVAFVDDDCVAEPDWLPALLAPFAAPDVHAVAGQVLPTEVVTPAQVLFDRCFPYSKGPQPRSFGPGPRPYPFPLNANEMGTGASMAFRRRTLAGVGGFVDALSAGGPARGGEDLHAFYAVLRAGYRLVYQPAARVRHPHPATAADLDRVLFNYGVAHFAYLTHCLLAGRDLRAVLRAVAILHHYARRCAAPRPADLPRRLLLRHLAGSLAGPGRYLVARRAYG